MTRALRTAYGTLAGVTLVGPALLVAYVFGGGWLSGSGVGLPTPFNLVGALAVVWAAVHATYVLAVPRERRLPAPPAVLAVTAIGTAIAVVTVVVALVR